MLLLSNGTMLPIADETLAKVLYMQPNALGYLHTTRLNTIAELENIQLTAKAAADKTVELEARLARLDHGIDLMLRIGVQSRQALQR